MATQSTPGSSLPGNRVAVPLQGYLRILSAVAAVSALGYAAVLGWRTNANGVVTAAAFAVGFLFATFALAGAVPTSIKIGDVEVKLQQARENGAVEGLTAGAAISKGVAAGDLPVEQVQEALHTALTSPKPLRLNDIDLPVAQLAPFAATARTQEVVDALRTVAHYAGRLMDHDRSTRP
ncbi:MAG: hypothetical protein JO115_12420 [Pseudonocardiales bacterium]|nr:hypothetical protein [Pseudonocardiales bacterium]